MNFYRLQLIIGRNEVTCILCCLLYLLRSLLCPRCSPSLPPQTARDGESHRSCGSEAVSPLLSSKYVHVHTPNLELLGFNTQVVF